MKWTLQVAPPIVAVIEGATGTSMRPFFGLTAPPWVRQSNAQGLKEVS